MGGKYSYKSFIYVLNDLNDGADEEGQFYDEILFQQNRRQNYSRTYSYDHCKVKCSESPARGMEICT